MGFKLVICPPDIQEDWPAKLGQAIPDIEVHLCNSVGEAMEVIADADAAHGDIVPELFARAKNLKWIHCPRLLHQEPLVAEVRDRIQLDISQLTCGRPSNGALLMPWMSSLLPRKTSL